MINGRKDTGEKGKEKKKIVYSKRKQQVKRQILAGCIFLAVIVVAVMWGISHVRKSRAEEALQAEAVQTEKKTEKTKVEETPEERLARVKKEAREARYPAEIIKLLDKNPETVDFVENYGKSKGLAPAASIKELEPGQIPSLLQWDLRWGCAPYGKSTVAASGCGPTCLSMVIAGLTGDASVTPAVVAEYGTKHNGTDEENRTYWQFMRQAGEHWGVSSQEISLREDQIKKELEAGHPVICSVGPGDFTKNGHFIVLTAYKKGKVTVCDPFSRKNSAKTWKLSRVQEQIKALWAYSVKKEKKA